MTAIPRHTLCALIALAQLTHVQIAEHPARQFPDAPAGYRQQTLIAQLADAVFADFRPGYFFVVVMTALILGLGYLPTNKPKDSLRAVKLLM